MNDAYRAVNMLLEKIRKLDSPTIPRLQIETQLIRIKSLLVPPTSQDLQESIFPVILKLIANVQETCGTDRGCQHLEEMVQLVNQLAEKASGKPHDN